MYCHVYNWYNVYLYMYVPNALGQPRDFVLFHASKFWFLRLGIFTAKIELIWLHKWLDLVEILHTSFLDKYRGVVFVILILIFGALGELILYQIFCWCLQFWPLRNLKFTEVDPSAVRTFDYLTNIIDVSQFEQLLTSEGCL